MKQLRRRVVQAAARQQVVPVCSACRGWSATTVCDEAGRCLRPACCPACGRCVPVRRPYIVGGIDLDRL